MTFFVKWLAKEGEAARGSEPFETRQDALHHACDMLRSFTAKPHALWVEDENGHRVMMEPAITMRCRLMGRLA
jgi:hypothetical protein